MKPVYLDYCANTPVNPEVLQVYVDACQKYIGNANSLHAYGYESNACVEQATKHIASMLKVNPDEIIFTSGATEANNLAIKGIVKANRHVGRHIISTALEHSSVSACLTQLKDEGYEIDLLPITQEGIIDLEELEDFLRDDTCLVSLSLIDSEVGIIQPLEQVKDLLQNYPNCHLHIDATQAMGKIPVNFSIGDTISFAPHKFYGLNSSGVLIKKESVNLVPQMSGGQSTTMYRSGTPDVPMICALEKALELMYKTNDKDIEQVKELNEYLRHLLKSEKNILINSPQNSVPHIMNLSIPGRKGYEVQEKLNEMGICVSVKSACSSNLLPSKAVYALTHNRKRAMESFRVSIGTLTTRQEIDTLVEVLQKISRTQE